MTHSTFQEKGSGGDNEAEADKDRQALLDIFIELARRDQAIISTTFQSKSFKVSF